MARPDARELLLKEIEAIARNEKSMKPAAFAGAEHLLGCPEVLRRAGSQPTDDQLRQAVHDGLKAALATLPIRDQRIGEAILAAPGYENQTVNERKRTLDETHRIKLDDYKRRRKKILTDIVEYLQRLVESERPSGNHVFDEHQKAFKALEWVVSDTLELRYACEAYQFMTLLNGTLAAGEYGASMLQSGNENVILDMLYERHMELIVSAGYCFDDEPYSTRTRIHAHLPGKVLERISQNLACIFDVLPFSSDERVAMCGDWFTPCADLLFMRGVRRDDHDLWLLHFGGLRAKHGETYLSPVLSGCRSIGSAGQELDIRLLTTHESRLSQLSEILGHYYGVRASTIVFNGDSVSLHDHFAGYIAAARRAVTYSFAPNL